MFPERADRHNRSTYSYRSLYQLAADTTYLVQINAQPKFLKVPVRYPKRWSMHVSQFFFFIQQRLWSFIYTWRSSTIFVFHIIFFLSSPAFVRHHTLDKMFPSGKVAFTSKLVYEIFQKNGVFFCVTFLGYLLLFNYIYHFPVRLEKKRNIFLLLSVSSF